MSDRNRVQYKHGGAFDETKRPWEDSGEGIITPERIERFRESGFLVARGLFPPEQMFRIRSFQEQRLIQILMILW